MKPKVSIVLLVDAVGALSDRTLHQGNLALVDDSPYGSRNGGTPELVTAVLPGQVVQWTAIHVDVQTPVEIEQIAFLGPGEGAEPVTGAATPVTRPDPGYAAVPAYASGVLLAEPEAPASPYTAAPPSPLASNGLENHDLLVWEGIVPFTMAPGVPYRYRLSIRLHEGPNSVLHVDTPALLRV
ncbi:hypothetical protein EDD29_5985 [Actinocorallia herbida]|uniref:Inclusion body protein n=1 Tax=Actinocorallia herbida TaxID=58109 RepID=A0A3N1D464_9ACTN|nr:hypothetical protein [Actinocorallia herbida]ROO88321.1 hypothetical protein EDD29_5985 [Actinocorallia herbida]